MGEREAEHYEEVDPYQLRPGEEPTPHLYWDEGRGKMMVRYYVTRNGDSRLLPGEPEEATTRQIAEYYKKRSQGKVAEYPKPAKPSEAPRLKRPELPRAA